MLWLCKADCSKSKVAVYLKRSNHGAAKIFTADQCVVDMLV